MSSWAIDIAKEFKKRNNIQPLGAILGVVVSPLPDIKIKLLAGSSIITKEQIYLARNITNRWKIEATFKEFESVGNTFENGKGDISISTTGSGSTEKGGAVKSLSQNGSMTSSKYSNTKENKTKGKFILQTVFNLEQGMHVLVIPNYEEDKFFIVDVMDYAKDVSLEWEYYQK